MKSILPVVSAIFVGFLLSLYTLQENEHFKQVTQQKLNTIFQTMFECYADHVLSAINFFTLHLHAQNVLASERTQQLWRWKATDFTVDSSWLAFATSGKLGISIVLKEINAHSIIDNNQLAIADHLKKMIFDAADAPITLKNFVIQKGTLTLADAAQTITSCVQLTCDASIIANRLNCALYITDSHLYAHAMNIFHALSARIHIEKNMNEKSSPLMHTEGNLMIDLLPEDDQECHFNGYQNGSISNFFIRSKQHSFNAQCIYDHTNNIVDIKTSLRLNCLQRFIAHIADLDGTIEVQLIIKNPWDNPTLEGTLSCNALTYAQTKLDPITITMNGDQTNYSGAITVHTTNGQLTVGSWNYHIPTAHGTMSLHNPQTITLPYSTSWYINGGDARMTCTVDNNIITSDLDVVINNQALTTPLTIHARCNKKDTETSIQGAINNYSYTLQLSNNPWHVTQLIVTDQNGATIVHCDGHHDQKSVLNGTIDCSLMRFLASYWHIPDIRSHGTLLVHASHQSPFIDLKIDSRDLNVSHGTLFNFIKNIAATIHIDTDKKTITLSNAVLQWHEGSIETQYGIIRYNAVSNKPYLHIPCIIKDLFVNHQKDMFAILSGALLIHTKNNSLACSGALSIDQGEYRKNIMGSSTQMHQLRSLSLDKKPIDIACDITVKTQSPTHIRTPFLSADAAVHLNIKNRSNDPHITGTVTLSSGILKFPYKPLYITRANLYILAHQLDNPSIELVAKGHVKKYYITLRVMGTAQQPHISLESTPALTEENIITLLLAGSEKGSLATAMPALIMQNLQQLIINSDQSPSALERYFNNILRPFKRIRIVPSFIDQTGRGGFRGAIEIEASDRLSALIQKNFSLSEDTKLEVEYLLSDDITIRAIKDERSDLGGEVEMRWKF